MLTGLLLAFGWLMLRDGMAELPKYAGVYAAPLANEVLMARGYLDEMQVLCGLNFFFQILPLFSELNGRVVRRMASLKLRVLTRKVEVSSSPTYVGAQNLSSRFRVVEVNGTKVPGASLESVKNWCKDDLQPCHSDE